MNKPEMISLLNKCYEAVNESIIGPVEAEFEGKKVLKSQFVVNILEILVRSQLPILQEMSNTIAGGMTLKEPGENWKEDK